jgi:hypothetical protein
MAITKITNKIKCNEIKYIIAYFMEDPDHPDISFYYIWKRFKIPQCIRITSWWMQTFPRNVQS